MPIQITCPCGTLLRIPDNVAGRNVKCPKCNAIVAVPATPVTSPPAPPKPAPPTVAAAPVKPAPVKPATAKPAPGKPAAQVAKPAAAVTAPAPTVKNGAGKTAKPAAPAPQATAKPVTHAPQFNELPDPLRDRAKVELQKGEAVVWAGQPCDRLISLKWWSLLGFGFIFCAAGSFFAILFFVVVRPQELVVNLIVGGLVSLFILGGPLFGLLLANSERSKYLNRAYLVTNRRCLVVHRPPNDSGRVETYAMPKLQFLFTRPSWFVRGGGDLVLESKTYMVRETSTRSMDSRTYRQTDHYGFLLIENVNDVEDVVRRTIVQPWLDAEERGEDPAVATGQVQPAEKKAAPAQAAEGMVTEAEEEDVKAFHDPNEKDLPLATRQALMKWPTPPHLDEKLQQELGRGEKLVWTGKPSVLLVILNGLILPAGALLLSLLLVLGPIDLIGYLVGWPLGALKFVVLALLVVYLLFGFVAQPPWRWMLAARTDYVLTNRRAIVWRPGLFGIVTKEEYRPDELVFMRRAKAWFLGEGTGSVIFRTIITKTTRTDNRGHTSTSTTTTHYGFLDIYHADAVELLIGVTLLAQLKQDNKSYKISGGIVAEYEKLQAAHTALEDTRKRERRWMLLGGVVAALALFLVCGGGTVNLFITVPWEEAKQGGPDGKPKETKPALSPLEQALADLKNPDHGIREKAGDVLKGMKVVDSKKGEVSAALEKALRESGGPFEPGHYLEAMKVWATPDAAETLLEKVRDPEAGVRRGAMEILGQLKIARAAEPIAERLTDAFDRPHAEKALKAIGKPAEQAVLKYANHTDPRAQEAARRLLKDFGTGGDTLLPQIVEDLESEDARTRNAAVASVAQMKTADPKFRAEVAKLVGPRLADGDGKTRENAAQALIVWGTQENVPQLIAVLTDKSDKLRHNALDALLPLKDARCAEAVAERLGADFNKDTPKAKAVLVALGKAAEPAVIKQLDASKNKQVRITACQILEEIGTQASVDALMKAAGDRDRVLKAAAEKALNEVKKRP